jgi:hypothetical protein
MPFGKNRRRTEGGDGEFSRGVARLPRQNAR